MNVKIINDIFGLKICRSLIINENLEVGTQIAYIKKALDLGYSVVVLNTNNNYERVEGLQFFQWLAPIFHFYTCTTFLLPDLGQDCTCRQPSSMSNASRMLQILDL